MDIQTFLTTVGGSFEQVAETAVEPSGSVENSVNFPGSADTKFLSSTEGENLSFGNDFTVTFFCRPTFIGETGTIRGIFGKGSLDSVTTGVFGVYYSEISGKLSCTVSDGSDFFTVESGASPFTINTWHFVHISYNATTDVLSMSIDRDTATTATSVLTPQEIAGDLRVGSTQATGHTAWKGQISLLGVFGDVLDSTAIDDIYNDGVGKKFEDLDVGTQTSAFAFWDLDELSDGSGAVVRADDAVVNALDLSDAQQIPSTTEVPA